MCEAPERSWDGMARPRRLLLAGAALVVAALGLWRGGLEGAGLVALAVGLLVAAVVLPTVREVEFGFPVGVKVSAASRSREDELRAALLDHKPDLELTAQLLCDDPEQAARLMEAAWADAVRVWRGPAGDPHLRTYVLCVLVQLTRAQHRWGAAATDATLAPLAALPWEQRTVVVLHEFARLTVGEVARVLEQPEVEVADQLAEAERRLRVAGAPGATGGVP